MKTVRVTAHAKINLTLDVVGEEGGYHALDSLVATIALGDRIIARARTDGRVSVTMHGMGSERIPAGRNNAALAAERFFAAFGGGGADITVYKRIPIGGGLGGSSADAAGVLNALAKLYDAIADMGALKTVADGLGSDTGYLLTGGYARMQGRGERITPLEGLPALHLLIACPRRGVSTPKCFRAYDEQGKTYPPCTERVRAAFAAGDAAGAAGMLGNHLFAAAAACEPGVAEAASALRALAPLGVNMTGSGSASYAVFASAAEADAAARRVQGFRIIRTSTFPLPSVGGKERR